MNGILQFLQSGGSYIPSLPQVLFDYILAFAALGVAGFFYKSKIAQSETKDRRWTKRYIFGRRNGRENSECNILLHKQL